MPHEDRDPRVDSGLPDVMARYKAARRFKLGTDLSQRKNTEESRVHIALLEYGETLKSRYGLAGGGDGGDSQSQQNSQLDGASSLITFAASSGGGDEKNMSAFERKLAVAAKKAAAAEAELAKEVAQEEDTLLSGMQSLDSSESNASSKLVGSIVGLGTDEIAAAAARYELSVEEARKRVEGLDGGGVLGQVASHKRQKAALEKRQESLQPEVQALIAERTAQEEVLENKMKSLRLQQGLLEEAKAKVASLEAEEAASGMKDELVKLKSLVMMNEQVRAFFVNIKSWVF